MAECVTCGEANPAEARFCSACGTLLPVAGEGVEIRKTVTILFCDVVGSTALGEKTDPETTRRVMSRYAREMSEVVRRHGGTVERFRGDEVMAVFGVPTVHEDDALRAVRAAKEMQRRLATLNDELDIRWGVRLECRIGINTGEVVAGDPGTGETFVTGDAVNVAKRLEQAARPGEILIGTATYPLVKDASKFGPRYRFSAKGKREPVVPFRLDDVDARAEGYARRLDAPLVGRRDELGRLGQLVGEGLRAERARIVAVVGPAGIGKSRLVREVADSVRDRADVVTGRCVSYGTGITYWPLVELLDDLGGLDALAPVLAAYEEAEVVLERVQTVIGAGEGDVPSDEVFWAVRRLFEWLAERRPLLICLEDLHWAEPTMLDLVEYLTAFAAGPMVLLCIARPELLERRPSLGGGAVVELEQLSLAETDELVTALGVGDEALRDRIAATADGNPLFAEQLAAAAAEAGTAPAGEALHLPASINALLEARLDSLEPPERRMLERAAVAGREFWLRAIVDISEEADRTAVAGSLLALVRKGLIRPTPSRPTSDDAYRFRHTLIREAAYAGMPKLVRANLHERYARWLAKQSEYPAHDEILGYHLEQAVQNLAELGPPDETSRRLGEEAAEVLARAGRRAAGRGDSLAAANLLRRATSLAGTGGPRRSEWLLDLATALRESGRFGEVGEVLDEAADSATSVGDERLAARIAVERSFLSLHIDPVAWANEAEEVVTRAIAELERHQDDFGLARGWTALALLNYLHCRIAEMETMLERALLHARRSGKGPQVSTILNAMSRAALVGPMPVGDALAACSAIGSERPEDMKLEALLSYVSAVLEAMRGHVDEARALYRRGHGIYEELGMSRWLAAVRAYSGAVELLADDPAAAERELREGSIVLHATGDTLNLSTVAALLAESLRRQERHDEAWEQTRISEQTASVYDVFSQVGWRTTRALLAVQRGSFAEARALADEARKLAAKTDNINMHADALTALGQVASAEGLLEEAAATLESAVEHYEAKGNEVSAAAARALLEQAAIGT
jgi:class 3 adenylate cyclase/predicted ATPase